MQGLGNGNPFHAAGEKQHAARGRCGDRCRRPGPKRRGRSQRLPEPAGHQRPKALAQAIEGPKQTTPGHERSQRPAREARRQGTGRPFVLEAVTGDLKQVVVDHPRGAGGFAVAAGEAAVQVARGDLARPFPLKGGLHEPDAPPGAIKFVARFQIGGTGRIAKAAVHAAAEHGFGALPFARREERFR